MLPQTKLFLPLFLLGLSALNTAGAVTVDTNAIRNKQLFGIEFPGETRAYFARENMLRSISKQEYITTGFRVVEVNVMTDANALLRIYYSRPLMPGEYAAAVSNVTTATTGIPTGSAANVPGVQAMADKARGITETITGDVVMKEYPIATHAKTIEFRVTELDELLDLYDELEKHWRKEPGYFEDGQLISDEGTATSEQKPRSLGGTLFKVKA